MVFSSCEVHLMDERARKKAKIVAPNKKFWLGWQDSNLRMTGPKPAALPLGYIPIPLNFITNHQNSKHIML